MRIRKRNRRKTRDWNLGVRGVYMNPSIMDEGAIVKTSQLQGRESFVPNCSILE